MTDTFTDTIVLAKKCGAKIESWMTNPPKVGLFYMTPEQLEQFRSECIQEERQRIANIIKAQDVDPAFKLRLAAAIEDRK